MSSIHGQKPILILMGPTASGKSALGISIAKRVGGAILNADAMQCYGDLGIITARPTPEEMADVPHYLYGIWGARTHGNAALWQEVAVAQIQACHAAGQVPILLGGTGMYLKGLTEGLSPVPPISPQVKAQVAAMTDLHYALQQHDPRMATKLAPNDSQRIGRALEVVLQTGKSLLDWQAEAAPAPFELHQCHTAYIQADRAWLYARIDRRFVQMLKQGALAEVEALMAHFSVAEMAQKRFPVLKAHGVPELMAHLRGQMSLEEAIAAGQQNTRNYAKRQMTWLRGQVGDVARPIAYDASDAAINDWLDAIFD